MEQSALFLMYLLLYLQAGRSQVGRKSLTLARGLEEAWLLAYLGSHGTKMAP